MTKAKQKIFSFLLVFSFFLFLVSANSVLAGSLLKSQEGFGANGGTASVSGVFSAEAPTDIRVTVAKLIKTLLGLMGIIFTVLVLYAGFLWMTAAGNDTKVADSKKILSRSVIGLVIILSAYSITGLVICTALDSTANLSLSCVL